MRTVAFILAALLWAPISQAQGMRDIVDERILSFETSTAPFEALRGSRLTRSGEHYKHGERSVRWAWNRPGAQLRIEAPVGYLSRNPDPTQTSVSTFVFWLYTTEALPGELRFEFRKQGRTCAWFDYGLHFTGWRGAWIAFDRDMQGTPEEGMDEVVVSVRGAKRGVLYFDHLIRSSFQDVRYHTADFQAPSINAATTNHWLVLLQSWRTPLPERAAAVSDAELREIRTIETRLRELLLDERNPRTLDDLRRAFEAYEISENADGTLRGKPVWFVRYAETYLDLGHLDVAQRFVRNQQTLRACNDLLFQIAVAYNTTAEVEARAELARMYLLLTRHLLDQGFAAGSALGTLHHLGYSMRNFYTAPVLMREVLRGAGLERELQQAMEWFSGVGEVKTPPAAPGMDIDAFNTSLIGRLASIVLMPDSPAKATWLACFSRWVDNGYKLTEGTSPTFKSEGTVFHHRRHYPAYAVDGFSGGAVNAVWLLSRTRFAVSPESHENLKRALLEMRFYCNLRSFPLAFSGRHPDGRGELIPWHYARLAVAGTPDGRADVDRELAAAYLRVAVKPDQFTHQFAVLGIAAEPAPSGTRAYGYNASVSHRRGNWLLTAAGHSRYLWAAETYQGANHYGRYLTHGSLQLLSDGDPVGSFGSGFRPQGWDWRHIPGTTALEIPMDRMRADIRNVDTHSGCEELLLSDEAFVGGVSHRGQEGLFAMKLHEHDKYNGSLRAFKTFFFFDNRVVALGSQIENTAPGRVHTTLFQHALAKTSDPITVRGDSVTAFPYRVEFEGGVVCDNLRNAYFIPRGRVVVTREGQHSPDQKTDAPTQGDFTTAYIDHGGVIRGGGYEYMMVVHASDDAIAAYAEELPYRVLRRDSTAHIVRDEPSGVTAYALFAGGEVGVGALVRVSMPALVMISGGEESIRVSVCDPDLRLYEGPSDELFDNQGRRIERSIYAREWIDSPSQASEVRVTVRGRWLLADDFPGCRAEVQGENTVLVFTCREAATREVRLVRH